MELLMKKLVYDHLGKAYPSVKEMCKAWGIKEWTYYDRMEKGYPLADVLSKKNNSQKECFDHLGNTFQSIREMCRYWGITEDNYRARRKKGWSLEETLTKGDCKTNITCRDHLGNEYQSIDELCKAWNISRSRYEHRIRAGYSLKDALTLDCQVGISCCDHLGNKYSSVKEMCDTWGVSRAKYEHRIKKGFSLEDALTLGDLSNTKKSQDHLENTYSSFTEMCNAYGVDRTTVSDRLEREWTLEEALTGNRKKQNPKSVPCTDHKGIHYSNYAEMCRAYGITYSVFKKRRSLGWTIEEALTGQTDHAKPNSKFCVDHLGNEFKTIRDMCSFWGITPDLHKGRLRDGWTLEETLTIPRQYSLGEYRVCVILKEYVNAGQVDCYFHDITIKKVFTCLEKEKEYKQFMDKYEEELKRCGINISRRRLSKFRFDFSIIKNEELFAFIEFDGEQHFRFIDIFFKTLENFLFKQNVDQAKNLFSELSKIPLLRIRFDQSDNNRIRYMVGDLIKNPQKYLYQHNTYLSNEEYMKVFEGKTSNAFPVALMLHA